MIKINQNSFLKSLLYNCRPTCLTYRARGEPRAGVPSGASRGAQALEWPQRPLQGHTCHLVQPLSPQETTGEGRGSGLLAGTRQRQQGMRLTIGDPEIWGSPSPSFHTAPPTLSAPPQLPYLELRSPEGPASPPWGHLPHAPPDLV